MATPDLDVFVEALSLSNEDLRGMRILPLNGAMPAGLRAGSVYRMPALTADEIEELRRQAAQVAPAGAIVAGPPPGVPPARPGPGIAVPAEIGGYKYGDLVPGVVAAPIDGGKSVHTLAGGALVFVSCIRGRDRPSFLRRPGGWDPRTVQMAVDGSGKAETSLKDVVEKCFEKPVGWQLPGPRTAKWCLRYLLVEGLGLEGHHEHVRQSCIRLTPPLEESKNIGTSPTSSGAPCRSTNRTASTFWPSKRLRVDQLGDGFRWRSNKHLEGPPGWLPPSLFVQSCWST